MVTVFSKITDTENPFYKEIDEVLNSFKDGSNAKKIEAIRNETDKEKRNMAKSKLVSVCFSGEFSRRAAKNIINHSGFACLDFDDVDDAVCLRDSLQDNEFIYSAFISPSGNVSVIKDINPRPIERVRYNFLKLFLLIPPKAYFLFFQLLDIKLNLIGFKILFCEYFLL
jgi:hypothetical protein